jgi:hypothetical protein
MVVTSRMTVGTGPGEIWRQTYVRRRRRFLSSDSGKEIGAARGFYFGNRCSGVRSPTDQRWPKGSVKPP